MRPRPATDGRPSSARPVAVQQDPRLPAVGTALVKRYKGTTLQVVVQPQGFKFEGRLYKTLSTVAKAISGTHINGFRFFGLGGAK